MSSRLATPPPPPKVRQAWEVHEGLMPCWPSGPRALIRRFRVCMTALYIVCRGPIKNHQKPPPPPPRAQVSAGVNKPPARTRECASGCPWSTARATAPSLGRGGPCGCRRVHSPPQAGQCGKGRGTHATGGGGGEGGVTNSGCRRAARGPSPAPRARAPRTSPCRWPPRGASAPAGGRPPPARPGPVPRSPRAGCRRG